MTSAVRALPEGTYRAALDADGHRSPVHIEVAATIADGRVTVDFEGSSPEQHDTSVNCVMNTTFSDTYYPFKCSLLPHLPNNEGLTRFSTSRRRKGASSTRASPARCGHAPRAASTSTRLSLRRLLLPSANRCRRQAGHSGRSLRQEPTRMARFFAPTCCRMAEKAPSPDRTACRPSHFPITA